MISSCKFTNGRRAFTLIELLVVISIIALLLSVIIPSLRKAKEAAQTVICTSNLKQWKLLVGFFLDDNKGIFPDADWNNDGSTDPHGQWWIQPLKPYNENPDILICAQARLHPAENYAGDEGRVNEFHPTKKSECWGSRDQVPAPTAGKWTWASYAPNAWIMNTEQGSWGIPDSDRVKFWSKQEKVTSPYNVPLFLDSSWVDVWPRETDRPNDAEYGGTGGNGSMRQLCHTRHGKMTNVVFCDGSARKIDIKKLWALKWHKDYNTTNAMTSPDAPWPAWMR